MMPFVHEPLDPKIHDRKGFTSGVPMQDAYIQRYAAQHQESGLSQTYVLVPSDDRKSIIAYYTLSMAQVGNTELSAADRKKFGRYPVPAVRIGQLAVAKQHQGKRFGQLAIAKAIEIILQTRTRIGTAMVIVELDSADPKLFGFYKQLGFKPSTEYALRFYLPLGT
jgi:GNAT superfamily N-acetyltransferase